MNAWVLVSLIPRPSLFFCVRSMLGIKGHYDHHLWHFCADYHNGTTLLAPEDLLTDLLKPYDTGARGVVMWGSGSELNNSTFLEVGYYFEAFITVCN